MRSLCRAACRAALVVLTLVMAACGPGVGGTGTGYGDEPGAAGLAWFAAQPEPVCNGALASVLACSAVVAGGSSLPTREVTLSGACAVATLADDQVVLDVICGGWVFAGRWGRGGDTVGRYYGLIGTDPMAQPTDPGTLDVQVDSSRLTVWLRDANGALVAGPLVLDPPTSGAGWRSE
ncbi:MAG: hypothetical protein H6933_05260 [Burkholderiaceae bacterium]|nr:hypothetical protein [Rhodoferax sp.]MCP5284289.1 hypothetical protein [Burkholderiaceae bacterium]